MARGRFLRKIMTSITKLQFYSVLTKKWSTIKPIMYTHVFLTFSTVLIWNIVCPCACRTCEAPRPPPWRSWGNSSHCRRTRLEERPALSVPLRGPDWIQRPHWAVGHHSDLEKDRGRDVWMKQWKLDISISLTVMLCLVLGTRGQQCQLIIICCDTLYKTLVYGST